MRCSAGVAACQASRLPAYLKASLAGGRIEHSFSSCWSAVGSVCRQAGYLALSASCQALQHVHLVQPGAMCCTWSQVSARVMSGNIVTYKAHQQKVQQPDSMSCSAAWLLS